MAETWEGRMQAFPSSSGLNHRPPCGSNNDRALKTSTLSSNRSDASLSNMVDSSGFLGWGESVRHRGFAVLSADLNVNSTAIDGGGGEKGSGKRDDDVSDGLSQGESGETWRIEDYEGSNDYAKLSGPGRMLFANVRLTFGPAAKSRRPTITGVPGDDFIKNILLKQGRRSTANEAMLSSATNRARERACAASDSKRRKSAFAPHFGISRKGSRGSLSPSEHEDKYYSRPSIHLNREYGVDIG
jgi:hypothetical protein